MSHLFKFAENILNNLDTQTQSALSVSSKSLSNEATAQMSGKKKKNQQQEANKEAPLKPSQSSANMKQSANFTNSTLTLSASATNSSSNFSALLNNNKLSSNSKEDELINFLNSADLSPPPLSGQDDVKFIIGDKLNAKHGETDEESNTNNTSLNNSNENAGITDENDTYDKDKLKKEIVSLNDEIKALLKRIKNTEEGTSTRNVYDTKFVNVLLTGYT